MKEGTIKFQGPSFKLQKNFKLQISNGSSFLTLLACEVPDAVRPGNPNENRTLNTPLPPKIASILETLMKAISEVGNTEH